MHEQNQLQLLPVYELLSTIIERMDILPPKVTKVNSGKGYRCPCCRHSVGDHDGYCSECGARVADTYMYYGKFRNPSKGV